MLPRFKQWFWKQFQGPQNWKTPENDPTIAPQKAAQIKADPQQHLQYHQATNHAGYTADLNIHNDIQKSIGNATAGIRQLATVSAQFPMYPKLQEYIKGFQQKMMAINKTWMDQARHNKTFLWNDKSQQTQQAMEQTQVNNKMSARGQQAMAVQADQAEDPNRAALQEKLRQAISTAEQGFLQLQSSVYEAGQARMSQLTNQVVDLLHFWDDFKQKAFQSFNVKPHQNEKDKPLADPFAATDQDQSTKSFEKWLSSGDAQRRQSFGAQQPLPNPVPRQ